MSLMGQIENSPAAEMSGCPLDRTSLRLAHLFDHLVGSSKQRFGYRKAERFGGREIDDEFKPGRLFNRKVFRLCSA